MDDFDLADQLLDDQGKKETDIISNAIEKSKIDPGAVYELEILAALQNVAVTNPADYARYRAKFKAANKENSVTQLDKLVSSQDAAGVVDTKADELVEMIQSKSTLFHNQDREGFVTFEQDGHYEVWPIQSTGFEEWAGYTFYKSQGKTAGESTLKTAIGSLQGIAKYDGDQQDTFLRVAAYQNGYVLDLCNPDWSVVFIHPDGWQVLKNSPVKFWRTDTMREIPIPADSANSVDSVYQNTEHFSDGKKGGSPTLWKHLNISEDDRLLLLAWIFESMRPETPFVVAEFIGGQGTAKSTTQSNLRDFIDPNAVNLRAAPKNVEDIFVSAGSNWIASYNNLSHITAAMQDAYCTLATGGGLASRKLYTNFDEALMETKRPVMMNGISSLATAQDLIDRTIRFNLPEIEEYREEAELNSEFLADKPQILGSLFSLFAGTLKKLPDIKIDKPPRMADFARLGEAMSQALGNEPGTFLSLYNETRRQAIINALDGSPVALAIQDLLDRFGKLDHVLMKDALEKLSEYRPYGEAWPKSPQGLGNALRRNLPGLKAIGINVIFHNRSNQGVHITIEREPLFSSKNDMESKSTLSTPSTPINEKSADRVDSEDQNPEQFFEQIKGMPEIESTPEEVTDVEYF